MASANITSYCYNCDATSSGFICTTCGRKATKQVTPEELHNSQIPDSDEEDPIEESSPPSLKRSAAFIEQEDIGDEEVLEHSKGYQRHFQKALLCSERYSPEPDLDVYFDDFGLSAQQRIAMCRTYANYLTQKLRSSGKLAAPRPKKK